jgi:hypothetical protein
MDEAFYIAFTERNTQENTIVLSCLDNFAGLYSVKFNDKDRVYKVCNLYIQIMYEWSLIILLLFIKESTI